jgi:hypothetical protein
LAFGANFFSCWIRIRIWNADPDPGDEFDADPDTDPDPKHCWRVNTEALEKPFAAPMRLENSEHFGKRALKSVEIRRHFARAFANLPVLIWFLKKKKVINLVRQSH